MPERKIIKGCYYLVLEILEPISVKAGALDEIKFEAGIYVYTGSAKNNLEKRVQRHCRSDKPKRWHIDYLTTNANVKVIQAWYTQDSKVKECEMAERIGQFGKAIQGFGCSDCKCRSHLITLNEHKNPDFKGRLNMTKLMINTVD